MEDTEEEEEEEEVMIGEMMGATEVDVVATGQISTFLSTPLSFSFKTEFNAPTDIRRQFMYFLITC